MTVINTNVKALYTQAALKMSARERTTAMEQLSTGKRINSAKDDAAGLAIASRMTQNIQSLNQAIRNAGDAVSFIQTAEGATNEITNMLQRMSELAVQSSNATYSTEQRGFLDLEFQQLKQEIVRISETHDWNGFPILNGGAGAAVGPAPVYKVSSDTDFNAGLNYSATVTNSSVAGAVTITGLVKSGAVSVTATSATAATATFTLEDGSKSTLTGTVDAAAKTITFAATNLSGGAGSVVITNATNPFINGSTIAFNVNRSFTPPTAMLAGDVSINGVAVGASSAADDLKSTVGGAAGSAIAMAAAINKVSSKTQVTAVVNRNVMGGTAMTAAVVSGTVTINGYVSGSISTSGTSTSDSRAATAKAINAITAKTGVVAIDTGLDSQGLRLEAADGRNIEVAFNTVGTAASFGSSTGLKEGVQTATYSLANSAERKIDITATVASGAARAGLRVGSYTANQSSISTSARALVTAAGEIRQLGTDDLTINGIAIRAASSDDDTVSNILPVTSARVGSGIAMAAAINASSNLTGVTATANATQTNGNTTTVATETGAQSLYVNGINVTVNLATTDTALVRRQNVVQAINTQTGQHGVIASDNGNGGISLSAPDGRNLSVWFDTNATNLTGASFGLGVGGTTPAAGVKGASGAGNAYTAADTVYSTVSMSSTKAINLTPGANGYATAGDFTALGYQAGTLGGEIDKASGNLPPQRAGRLSFQVGARADQVISIVLEDFGKNGTITGEITKDVNDEKPAVNINTVESANAVVDKVTRAMDNISATRAVMGAVMNRLEHVIDNLTNVATNSESSRSQIEDADYAAASTELARTGIMQQAATAVLAQANTDQQTVLKLLQ